MLELLGLDWTFAVQFGIWLFVFIWLSLFFFRPFARLFEMRHKRTVEDRDAAEKLVLKANAKMEEYERRMSESKAEARRTFETLLSQTKAEEARILGEARSKVKKISQEAMAEAGRQRQKIKEELQGEVEKLAESITARLLTR